MRRILYILILFSTSQSWGQDIHFTQLDRSPLSINPAFTGLYSGWERVTLSHKNQWINAGTRFLTTAVAADFNLFKTQRKKGAYLGLGLQLYNDVGGDSRFGAKQVLASVSGIVPISWNNSISVGFQAGIGQRSGSYDGLLFSNQFNGSQLDPSVNAFEFSGLNSGIYPDISIGAVYQYGGVKKTIVSREELVFNLGIALYHVNRPKISYSSGSLERINQKFVFFTSLRKDFSGSYFGFEALINHFRQNPHSELLISALMRYRYRTGSRMTGIKSRVVLSGGLAYRLNDAIAPVVKMENGNWSFSLSYDITISRLGSYRRLGGLEMSVIFKSSDFALFKRKR